MDWITHEEDVWFDFRGDDASQLVAGRYYRGTVDGFADFGVFVDLAPGVTGLLHRSELDQRLETLDWEAGDTVFVQVKDIRDNGDVDLAWSIRQDEREFRGARVHDPSGDHDGEPIEEPDDEQAPVRYTPDPDAGGARDETDARTRSGDGDAGSAGGDDAGGEPSGSEASEAGPATGATPTGDRERVAVGSLDDRVGEVVRVEAEVTGVRQTSGPTVFELRDESGTVDAAAFVEPGVRAYPDVEVGDAVRIDGEVRERRGELQVETEALAVLDDDESAAVADRLDDALDERARPETVAPLGDHAAVDAVVDEVEAGATAIRRAVVEGRPVVVRHPTTADGYVAGAAIERAVLPLVRAERDESDAEYHYFDRRPLDGPVYGMDPATSDLTRMLADRERFDEQLPLVVLAGAGSTAESLDGLELLDVYGTERLVLDAAPVDDEVATAVETTVAPETVPDDLTTGALAATLAAAVTDDDEVRASLAHLPATSYWESPPETYVDLAAEHGYDADECRRLREAVALEAYYQSYEDKRELVSDLLFGDAEVRAGEPSGAPESGAEPSLADHVSEQFREKLEDEWETAEANVEVRETDGVVVRVLDADAYTHRYDFPPTALLVDEIHRRARTDRDGEVVLADGTERHARIGPDDEVVTVGLETDELYVRSTADVDVRTAAEKAREAVPDAGVEPVGVRQGRVAFLAGRRDAVREAVIEAVVDQIA